MAAACSLHPVGVAEAQKVTRNRLRECSEKTFKSCNSSLPWRLQRDTCGRMTPAESRRRVNTMKNSTKAFALSAAMAGLMAGVTPVMHASTASSGASVSAGVLAHASAAFGDKDKHACKGQN